MVLGVADNLAGRRRTLSEVRCSTRLVFSVDGMGAASVEESSK
jgi:hypothetical protein